jgi:hypothetical protein
MTYFCAVRRIFLQNNNGDESARSNSFIGTMEYMVSRSLARNQQARLPVAFFVRLIVLCNDSAGARDNCWERTLKGCGLVEHRVGGHKQVY